MLRSVVVARIARFGLASRSNSWSQMSLKELKTACKNKGLKVSGRKSELIKRLGDLDDTKTIPQQGTKESWGRDSKSWQSIAPEQHGSSSNLYDPDLKFDSSNIVVPRKEHNTTTTNNDSNINTSQIKSTQIKTSPSSTKDTVAENESGKITPVERMPTSVSPSPVEQVQKSPSIEIAPKKAPPLEECRGMFKTIRFSGNRGQGRYSFGLRDKLFLLTATTCIVTWWWWPLVPNSIFASYRYLQSFF